MMCELNLVVVVVVKFLKFLALKMYIYTPGLICFNGYCYTRFISSSNGDFPAV